MAQRVPESHTHPRMRVNDLSTKDFIKKSGIFKAFSWKGNKIADFFGYCFFFKCRLS